MTMLNGNIIGKLHRVWNPFKEIRKFTREHINLFINGQL